MYAIGMELRGVDVRRRTRNIGALAFPGAGDDADAGYPNLAACDHALAIGSLIKPSRTPCAAT